MFQILFLLFSLSFSKKRSRSKRRNARNDWLNAAFSVTDFPRTKQFPILNPLFYPFGQTSPSFGMSSGERRKTTSRRKGKKRVYAPAAIPAVAVPAEELVIDGLPPGLDHVVINRPEVPQIPSATPQPTLNPSESRRWPTEPPTPSPYPVGVALGLAPVTDNK